MEININIANEFIKEINILLKLDRHNSLNNSQKFRLLIRTMEDIISNLKREDLSTSDKKFILLQMDNIIKENLSRLKNMQKQVKEIEYYILDNNKVTSSL